MMIGPEAFYEFECAGKTRDELLKLSKTLRSEIARYTKMLEDPAARDPELELLPSPDTVLELDYEYLQTVRKAFSALGEEYPATPAEQKAAAFDATLENLASLTYVISGYLYGAETFRLIPGDGGYFTAIYEKHISGDGPESSALSLPKEEVLAELLRLHMGDWKRRYENPTVLDGVSWSVTLTYRDGTGKCEFSGRNSFPWSFGRLEDLFGQFFPEVDPE